MEKKSVIYFFDALCGWCYGFTKVLDQIHQKYKEEVNFEIVSGGLFTGNRVGFINDVAGYIKEGAYKSVEERTGVKFGEKFVGDVLDKNSMYLDSIPAGKALYIVREKMPERAFEFGSALLKLFYHAGVSTDNMEKIGELAVSFGYDLADFNQKMNDPTYHEKLLNEFKMCADTGVRGYPAVVLKSEKGLELLSNGYVDFEVLDDKLKHCIK